MFGKGRKTNLAMPDLLTVISTYLPLKMSAMQVMKIEQLIFKEIVTIRTVRDVWMALGRICILSSGVNSRPQQLVCKCLSH